MLDLIDGLVIPKQEARPTQVLKVIETKHKKTKFLIKKN